MPDQSFQTPNYANGPNQGSFGSAPVRHVAEPYLRLARLCGVGAVVIGISGLLGWIYAIPVMNSIISGYKPIAISACIAFLLLGVVQFLAALPSLRSRISLFLLIISLLVTLFGLLEIVTLVFGVNVSIEDVVLRHYPSLLASPEANIAPAASVQAFFIGLAQSLYLYQWITEKRRQIVASIVGLIGSFVALGSAVLLLGYIYGTPLFYGSPFIPVSLLATLAAFLLGIGVAAMAGPESLPLLWFTGPSTRAKLLRAFLPLTAIILLLSNSLQYFLSEFTRINPALLVATLTMAFVVISGVVILQVARVIGNLIDRAEQERRQAEEELRLANETLEQRVHERTAALEASNKELEAFSYSVSHDLRAPLRSIDGFSKVLVEQYPDRLDERGQDYLNRVRAAAQRMNCLIDDMLNLSRIGRAEMRWETVDLSVLAGAIIAELRQRDPERRVEVDIQPGLLVSGDPALLRIVLDNLLGNAWKFTCKREVAQIAVGVTRDHERVYFVRDNGAGFDMAYADKLFIPFQRLHTDEEFPGTGVGLAIVQRIILRHGGRIWAESVEGEGATFYFTLGKEQA